ncbi:MAG TPA: transglycosylase SLT domain-containing protein, partial [Lentzea sp.]
MAYSYGQLETLWINAGGSKALAPLMAAIALAESGGNPAANNTTDNGGTQTSWGLWQISNGTHSWPGSADPNNAANNAKYAVAKYQSQGLSAWGTYDSGAYLQYYQGGTQASALPQGGTGSSQTATATDTSWWSSAIAVTPFGGLQSAISDVWGGLTGAGKALSGLDSIAQSLN